MDPPGVLPTWILRLYRIGNERCARPGGNDHLIVKGPVGYLNNEFVYEDRKGVTPKTL
jgi:hypothetical protein